ncbi:HtaA domain-containing protein [Microbacterium sp. A93]|uniref:HtaA domain-containing protein n=1 Tax=Microbacterium sp. A93 TaxID=3450716 RepID=UPI003F43BFD9
MSGVPDDAAGQVESEVRPGMSWGVKGTFTRYVDAVPDGRYGAGGGATAVVDGTFFFELEDASGYDPVQRDGVAKYRGDVRYKAHGGVLFVMLVDPWLELREGVGELTVVDAKHWPSREQRLALATLRLDEGGGLPLGWEQLEARLTPAGVAIFNDVYAVGEMLEPVRFNAGG